MLRAEQATDTVNELCFAELIIDVRKDDYGLTVEACSMDQVGVNIYCRARPDDDPEGVIDTLIESIEKLGIAPSRYRLVREDLPAQVVTEIRGAGCARATA